MLFKNKYRTLLSEAAVADMLDAEVSTTVKDTVEELEDELTTNVDLVPEKDMATNGMDLMLQSEMCIVRESRVGFDNGAKYMIEMSDLIRLCEEEEAAAVAEDPEAEVSADAGEMAEKVADDNGIPSTADVVVVVNSEMASLYAEMALLEAKAGRSGRGIAGCKKLKNAIEDCKNKGIKVVKTKK